MFSNNPLDNVSDKVKAGSIAGLLIVLVTAATSALDQDIIVNETTAMVIAWVLHTAVAWWKAEYSPSPSAIEEVGRQLEELDDALGA